MTTITFDVEGSGTKLTIKTQFKSVEIRDSMMKMGMNEGWSQSLDRLSKLVGNL